MSIAHVTAGTTATAAAQNALIDQVNTNTAAIATLTAGQIAFPATQNASSNANTLDDYEEGTYTPTWTSAGTAPAIGNGTLSGQYVKVGQVVWVYIKMTAGSTTTFGSANNWSFSIPFTCTSSGGSIGTGYGLNSSTNASYVHVVKLAASASVVTPFVGGSPDGYQAAEPFAWASGDSVTMAITYRASA